MTTVALDWAARSISAERAPVWVVPVNTQKLSLMPRLVSGMPCSSGTAMALEIPGTTAVCRPCCRAYSTSSWPRPNTNGSPPFRRTTCPCRLRHRHNQFIDLALGKFVLSKAFANVDFRCLFGSVLQQFLVHQGIVQHHICRLQGPNSLQTNEVGIARACTYQGYFRRCWLVHVVSVLGVSRQSGNGKPEHLSDTIRQIPDSVRWYSIDVLAS